MDIKNNTLYGYDGINKILKMNLNTNAKEEVTMLESVGIVGFLHFDSELNKLLIGKRTFSQSNLYDVNISDKTFILINENLQFNKSGTSIHLSDGQILNLTMVP